VRRYTPPSLTADANNMPVQGVDLLRLNVAADIAITGLAGAPPSGRLTIVNVGANTATFYNDFASSLSYNRILSADGDNVEMGPLQSVDFLYDHASQRWRVVTSWTSVPATLGTPGEWQFNDAVNSSHLLTAGF
jgi:hypothetical protein